MIRSLGAGLVGGVILACSLAPVRLAGPDVHALPPPSRTTYAIHFVYTSELADPYYVMSGPAESYARYSITTQFQALLRRQVEQLSDSASSRSATLSVHLLELTTRYRRVGDAYRPPVPEGPLYAMLDTGSPASWQVGRVYPLLAREEADFDIPAEIHKGASLIATVELSGDGVSPLRQTVTAKHDDLMTRWDFDPRDAYQYTDVLDTTLRVAAAQINEIVLGHLR